MAQWLGQFWGVYSEVGTTYFHFILLIKAIIYPTQNMQ